MANVSQTVDQKKIVDEDIKAALALLDLNNDAHWVDGKPNLQMLQEALGPELTVEDVNRVTGGADRIGIARARGVIMALPDAPPVNESQIAREKVKKAETSLVDLEAQIGETMTEQQALQRRLDGLHQARDRLVETVASGVQVSHADAVKQIQMQSVRAAEAKKQALQVAAAALNVAGIGKAYPSKLDEDLAKRKRSPDHVKNMGKFVSEQAQNRNAARG